MKTVKELAHQAFEDASTLSHGDIVRLASFVADHGEHKTFDADAGSALPSTGMMNKPSGLLNRLEPPRGDAPKPEVDYGHLDPTVSVDQQPPKE